MRESWLEGKLENVDALLQPAAHALVQARRDIERACENLTCSQVWRQPNGAPSTGFHLRHVAGSIDRLLTYARGANLNDDQLAFLKREAVADKAENAAALVAAATAAIETALQTVRAAAPETLFEPRFVGRERLETNVFGLLFHIAEHTQRHAGQIVTTAKVAKGDNYEL